MTMKQMEEKIQQLKDDLERLTAEKQMLLSAIAEDEKRILKLQSHVLQG